MYYLDGKIEHPVQYNSPNLAKSESTLTSNPVFSILRQDNHLKCLEWMKISESHFTRLQIDLLNHPVAVKITDF